MTNEIYKIWGKVGPKKKINVIKNVLSTHKFLSPIFPRSTNISAIDILSSDRVSFGGGGVANS